MVKSAVFISVLSLLGCAGAYAQSTGPCSVTNSALACGILQEYGGNPNQAFSNVLYGEEGHPFHFISDFGTTLKPLTQDIGRQANLLPLASPSSGVVLVYDPTLKTLVTGTDSLGPVLGERAETVGRHHIFVGFSYQFFNFNKIDGVNLLNFPNVLVHTDDSRDNSSPTSPVTCSVNTANNLNGCSFVRDRIDTTNSISLKVNQYTTYLTFGLTKKVDVSVVIPIENVRLSLFAQATIVPGTDGTAAIKPGTPDADSTGPTHFFHLFKDCANISPTNGLAGLAPNCLNHTFPDPAYTGSGSTPKNTASGFGDLVTRVKWNAWEGEKAGFAAGVDVRLASGDSLNYLGSGSYGVKPFAVLSYRARVAPHVLVGYEWNSNSITAGDLTTGVKRGLPNDFVYSVGADTRVTKWLTGDFDIVGQQVFDTETVSVTQQQYLANCGSCTANPATPTVTLPSLSTQSGGSYSITNASLGLKLRPLKDLSRLVVTGNVLFRLDDGGLRSKAAPLIGVGYTF